MIVIYPEIALRDCEHCLKYDYDEETGRVVEFNGRPQRRPRKKLPLCQDPKKGCPKGSPKKPNSLNRKNQTAYRHWRECKATGNFPDDELVAHHADIIQSVMNNAEELKRLQQIQNGL